MKKQKTSEEQVLTTNSEPIDAVKKKTVKSSSATLSRQFGIITLIIAVIGVFISVDSFFKLQEWNVGLKNFQEQVDKQLETEQQHLNNLENALKDIDARQQVLDKQLSSYHSAILPILQQKQPVDKLWQVKKAYNWLQQAELDLRWSGDWQGALLLLNASNNALKEVDIVPLQSIQSQIAADIAALAALKPINETVLLGQIKAISDQIVALPQPKKLAPPQTNTTNTSGWKGMLHHTWESIKSIVTIKPVDTVNSMPFIQSRQVLNENLFIALQQIQWALLKKDNTLYHWSVAQAIQIIQGNAALIDLNDPKTTTCLTNLKTLDQQNLTPTLPDLQPVCQQLKAYLDSLTAETVAEKAA